MASTYSSIHIYPGRRAGNIKQIINYVCNSNTTETIIQTPFIITSGSPIIENNNDYYTITFLSNGSIQFLVPLTVSNNDFYALVVGGGGSGGEKSTSDGKSGGGGGAGGEVKYTSLSVSQNINYSAIIGQGGSPYGQGNPSSFSSIVSNGGNIGGDANTGGTGGIGINGGGSGGNGGIFSPVKQSTNGANGTPITINSTTNYYGGGGGGGSYLGEPGSATGGLGGGGGGGAIPNTGTPNTGGGGGGCNGNPAISPGPFPGVGGSGVVILYFKYTPIKIITNNISNDCALCLCPSPINSKIIKNSNPDVIPLSTQTARIVSAIRYARGGRTVYGNAAYNSTGDARLLGRVEGGYEAPIKNKF